MSHIPVLIWETLQLYCPAVYQDDNNRANEGTASHPKSERLLRRRSAPYSWYIQKDVSRYHAIAQVSLESVHAIQMNNDKHPPSQQDAHVY